jgi:hypothetical protein
MPAQPKAEVNRTSFLIETEMITRPVEIRPWFVTSHSQEVQEQSGCLIRWYLFLDGFQLDGHRAVVRGIIIVVIVIYFFFGPGLAFLESGLLPLMSWNKIKQTERKKENVCTASLRLVSTLAPKNDSNRP